MPKAIKPLFFLFCAFFSATVITAQKQYDILDKEAGSDKTLKGIIGKEILAGDPEFAWFRDNAKEYTPNKDALAALSKNKDLQLLVFMGTWCHDSQYIIPKFYALLDSAGFPPDHVTLIGTDREKKTYSHLAEAMNVTNVPTIIVMKDGKEMGRVVEYGKYGLFDMELAEIINGSK